jgi:hypothetical protein
MHPSAHAFRRAVLAGVVALLGLVLGAGCDTSIEPFAEERSLYSVYGYLTLSGSQHTIRVRNLNAPVLEGSTRTFAGTVTLENLATGTAETLADSLVFFQGVATHNFQTEQDIQPRTQYRLSVERPDGRTAQTTATMPPFTELDLAPEATVGCTDRITAAFQNVPEPRLVRVTVGFSWRRQLRWISLDAPSDSTQGTVTYTFTPATLLERILPERVQGTVGQDPARFCTLLDDDLVRIAYAHFGPDWPADSIVADPLRSNIENGLGVFGGLHRDTLTRSVFSP